MFRGPHLIVSTMQAGTTPIFKGLWYDWTQQQPGIEHTNPLGRCWVPPIVAFYNQQRLLRTFSSPGSSIRSPHPGSPRVGKERIHCFPVVRPIALTEMEGSSIRSPHPGSPRVGKERIHCFPVVRPIALTEMQLSW